MKFVVRPTTSLLLVLGPSVCLASWILFTTLWEAAISPSAKVFSISLEGFLVGITVGYFISQPFERWLRFNWIGLVLGALASSLIPLQVLFLNKPLLGEQLLPLFTLLDGVFFFLSLFPLRELPLGTENHHPTFHLTFFSCALLVASTLFLAWKSLTYLLPHLGYLRLGAFLALRARYWLLANFCVRGHFGLGSY